jgi:hypothetical protein
MDPKKRKLASGLFMAAGVLIVASVITEYPIQDAPVPDFIIVIVAVVVFAIGAALGLQSS